MKAMLLAAGRGSRLKPLTDQVPKPLLQVGSQSLIEHNVRSLAAIGIRNIIINVCHLAKQIIEHLGTGDRYGVRIEYSFEKDSPMGTGGGIYQALPLLGDEPFIIMSADIWTDFSFDRSFLDAKADAHLVFVENPIFHPKGDYALTPRGQVSHEGKKFTYANIAKLHPKLFNECKPEVFPLPDIFDKAIKSDSATGELYKGAWFNVGTVEELTRLRETVL